MGLYGLSLATTLIYAFMSVTLFVLINKEVHFFGKREFIFTLRLILYGVLCWGVTVAGYALLNFEGGIFMNILRTGAATVFGFAVYGILVYAFHGKELLSGKN